jgi:hypothetical protein
MHASFVDLYEKEKRKEKKVYEEKIRSYTHNTHINTIGFVNRRKRAV